MRTIQAVDRAIAVLGTLAESPSGLSLSALAQVLELAPQTVQSLLRTLETHELVFQMGRGRPYQLGPKVHALSRRWLRGRGLGDAAQGIVAELSRQVGEYALLAELRGRTLEGLVEVSPAEGLVVRSELHAAERWPMMATGKVLLAYLEAPIRDEVLATLPVARSTADRRRLETQLELIRRDGYAVLPKAAPGVAALAVPVRDQRGAVAAALGIAVPAVRFAATREQELLRHLRAAAGKIEQAWRG